jgi:hypothetical protein
MQIIAAAIIIIMWDVWDAIKSSSLGARSWAGDKGDVSRWFRADIR